MTARSSVSRRLAALAIIPATFAGALAALPVAADAASPPRRLYACVTKDFRTLNLTTKSARCPDGQPKVSWNVAGAPGATGPRGARGAPGSDGAAGRDGAAGPQGPAGAIGPAGAVGPAGAAGPVGSQGPVGPAGATGPAGRNGSPDTPAEVLAKLLTVDGPGSGIDAEFLNGQPASFYQQRVSGRCAATEYMQEVNADGTVVCTDPQDAPIRAPLRIDQTGTADGALSATVSNAASTQTAVSVRHQGIGNAVDVGISNGSSGGRGISVDNQGVGPGVFSNTVGGNSIWGVVGSISAAALIGDSSSGEAVVARQNGAICERNIGRCNGIGAVVGRHDGTGGFGVRGFVTDPNGAIGVIGQAGISGGTGTGVRAENVNAANNDNALEAVTNGNGNALFAQGRTNAAYFRGAVTIEGDLTVTGTKSGFKIDDPRAPSRRTLTHTPLETDSLQVTYSGNVTTNGSGLATVKLASYALAIAGDWRYQLTPIGQFGQAIVAREVGADGSFQIRSEHPRTKVSWSVIGVRKDPQARHDAITAVTAKTGKAKGRYLDPTLYGKPASQAVNRGIKPTMGEGGARASAGHPKLASER